MVIENYLNLKADKIEHVLRQNRIASNVIGGTVRSQMVRYSLQAKVGTKVSAIQNLASALADALNVPYASVMRQGSEIAIETPLILPIQIPKHITRAKMAKVLALPGMDVKTHRPDRSKLGIFQNGRLIGTTTLIQG